MTLSFYAARANLSALLHRDPDWSHAQFAAALGYAKAWVKKWLKRLREEQAAGVPLEQTLQGHSRARKQLPTKTHPLVIAQILAIRDQPPEGLRRVPGQEAIRYYLQRDSALQFFQLPLPSCKTIYRVLKRHQRIPERGKPLHQPLERPKPMSVWQLDAERCLQCACRSFRQTPTRGRNPQHHRHGHLHAPGCTCALRFQRRKRVASPRQHLSHVWPS